MSKPPPSLSHAVRSGAALLLLLGGTVTARAEVLEIMPDGGVVSLSGGGGTTVRDADGVAADGVQVPDAADLPADIAPPARAAVPARYAATVSRLAARYAISPALLEALVWQESRWQEQARSRAGAIGLAQLMPATAQALRVDPRDPVANLEGGARFLRAQLDLFDGDIEKALAAYNAGPARVLKAGGVPPIAETRAYVAAIIGRLSAPSATGQ